MRLFLVLIILLISMPSKAQLDIQIINDSVLVYTTYQDFAGTPFPSNSLCVRTPEGVLMIDTPWDTTQLRPLLDTLQNRWHARPFMSVSTHFHGDRTNGVHWMEQHGIRTCATAFTRELCAKDQVEIPAHDIAEGTHQAGNVSFEVYYPGAGHAPDNIVVYFPQWKLLYGGCFIKSYTSDDLGYTGDADVKNWYSAAKQTRKRYKRAQLVVTGHQEWDGMRSLDRTITLLKPVRKEK